MAVETVLVCVTGQRSCERLIHHGADIAREAGAPLLVLSVSGSGANLLEDPSVSEALNVLYAISGQVGAEMTMLHDSDPRKAIAAFARERHVGQLVLGAGRPDPHGMVELLKQDLPAVAFHVIPGA